MQEAQVAHQRCPHLHGGGIRAGLGQRCVSCSQLESFQSIASDQLDAYAGHTFMPCIVLLLPILAVEDGLHQPSRPVFCRKLRESEDQGSGRAAWLQNARIQMPHYESEGTDQEGSADEDDEDPQGASGSRRRRRIPVQPSARCCLATQLLHLIAAISQPPCSAFHS